MSNVVSIFFVKTELEALASELIATQFEKENFTLLVYQGRKEPHLINPETFKESLSISYEGKDRPTPEKVSIAKGLTVLRATIEKNILKPEKIVIHTPRISTSKTNFSINFLKRSFPQADISVRLIPHGIVSINLIPITTSKKIKFIKKKINPINRLIHNLNYYIPKGDLIGGMDEIVDRIYTFKGIISPYSPDKVFELSGLKDYINKNNPKKSEQIALIIGQPLLKNGSITQIAHDIVSQKMHDWLKLQSIENVYYSKHPRSGDDLDFYQEDYRILNQEGPVEIALCELQPEIVISCYSTALATAKILLGDEIRAISFGLDLTSSDKRWGIAKYFESIGIELY